jgi:thiamine kinase-like enzyme
MEMFESAVERVTEIVRKWKDFLDIVKKLENTRKNLREKIYRCVNQPSDFPVLAHGDVWTNNFMFQYKNGVQSPNDVRFVSFRSANPNDSINGFIDFSRNYHYPGGRGLAIAVLELSISLTYINELLQISHRSIIKFPI